MEKSIFLSSIRRYEPHAINLTDLPTIAPLSFVKLGHFTWSFHGLNTKWLLRIGPMTEPAGKAAAVQRGLIAKPAKVQSCNKRKCTHRVNGGSHGAR